MRDADNWLAIIDRNPMSPFNLDPPAEPDPILKNALVVFDVFPELAKADVAVTAPLLLMLATPLDVTCLATAVQNDDASPADAVVMMISASNLRPVNTN